MWGQVAVFVYTQKYKGIIPTRVGTRLLDLLHELFFRDHPHACGDKPLYTITTRQIVGSSPRVWGQVKVINMRGSKRRIIPTRVGTRLDATHVGVGCTDHPHACGDKAAVKLFKLVRDVSSPRVWGQGLYHVLDVFRLPIIPTRVGTRPVGSRFSIVFRDHPHACGDKLYHRIFDLSRGGSSPRVWGQAEFRLRAFCSSRIIPTRVGTSDEELMNELKKRDHPHAYGDKGTRRLNRSQSPGSSPRVWGQVAVFVYTQKYKGIIPTRVGTRLLDLLHELFFRDHPHACGDKPLYTITTRQIVGSSPRVWGQGGDIGTTKVLPWIIPTRVGTRFFLSVCIIPQEDHPHACGDKRACRQP